MIPSMCHYVPAFTGVYPKKRFFYRHSVDTPVKLKDPSFLEEMLVEMAVSIEENSVSVINAVDGTGLSMARNLASQRELLVCGAPMVEFRKEQDELLAAGVYPNRMELGTLSMLGSLMDYARYAGIRRPILYLEPGLEDCCIYIVTAERVDLCRRIGHGLDSMLPVLGKELGVTDADSARKLLFSSTFDFTDMGPTLLGKLIREMRASTGFYEVQTGQSIGHVVLNLIPGSLDWTRLAIASALGLDVLDFDYAGWLDARGVKLAEGVELGVLHQGWMGVLGMMVDLSFTAEKS